MVGGVVGRKQMIKGRAKVKTGCGTCRIRKVKCDEHKPLCQRCTKTGRHCDGYETPFKPFIADKPSNISTRVGTTSEPASQSTRSTFIKITPQDIDLLSHYFSTKTMLDVKLDCEEEARQVLEASLTDLPVQHAVSSLRALRKDLETFGDGPASGIARQVSSYYYGLEQYNTALRGLTSNLSTPDAKCLRSALLCCQIFISIEQVRKNYTAMAQHIIQGLRIMQQYRARPVLVAATGTLMPAHHDPLPLLDVFIIKLFAAPCRFAEPSTAATAHDEGATISSTNSPSSDTAIPIESQGELRTIAPNMRSQLTKIASSAHFFLDKVSQVQTPYMALQLLPEKTALLNSLDSWLISLELLQTSPEPISVSFLRMFHLILKIILLSALDLSERSDIELHIQSDRLQDAADILKERLKTYTMYAGHTEVVGASRARQRCASSQ